MRNFSWEEFQELAVEFGSQFEVLVWNYKIFQDGVEIGRALCDCKKVYALGWDGKELKVSGPIELEMYPGLKAVFDVPEEKWEMTLLRFIGKLKCDLNKLREIKAANREDFGTDKISVMFQTSCEMACQIRKRTLEDGK